MPASSDYRYSTGAGPRDRSLRVGDKERDAVGEILRQRHLEGRLDSDEFQGRLERCLEAKTYAQLDELIADFPRESADRHWDTRSSSWRPWPLPLLFLLPLGLIAAIVAGGGHLAWLAFPLIFFVVLRPLAWGRGYGRGFGTCGHRRISRL